MTWAHSLLYEADIFFCWFARTHLRIFVITMTVVVNSECSFWFWLVCHLLSRDPVWCIFLPWKDVPVRMTDRLLALCENTMIPRRLPCNCPLEKCKSNLVIHRCILHCNWTIKQTDMSSLWLEFCLNFYFKVRKSRNFFLRYVTSPNIIPADVNKVCTQWKWELRMFLMW